MSFLDAILAVLGAIGWFFSSPIIVVVYGLAMLALGFLFLWGITFNLEDESIEFHHRVLAFILGVGIIIIGMAIFVFVFTNSPGPFEWHR